jgi:hypothetical protein
MLWDPYAIRICNFYFLKYKSDSANGVSQAPKQAGVSAS